MCILPSEGHAPERIAQVYGVVVCTRAENRVLKADMRLVDVYAKTYLCDLGVLVLDQRQQRLGCEHEDEAVEGEREEGTDRSLEGGLPLSVDRDRFAEHVEGHKKTLQSA